MPHGISILIVDDEFPARKKIKTFLKQEAGIVALLEAANGDEAVQQIREGKPDLIFLDIQMPGMSGFEVIETVGVENMPAVIFVTAHDQYALEAFEVQAVDYLLKPFDPERFKKSFDRALRRVQLKNENTAVFKNLLGEVNQEKKYLQRVLVNLGARFFFVKTNEIVFIEADEKYAKLHTAKENYLIRETMNNLEQRLDPEKFSRVQRSYIVNLDFIKEIHPWSHGDFQVVLKIGVQLAGSRRFRERLFGLE